MNELIDSNFNESILLDNSQFFNLSFLLLVLSQSQLKYCLKTFCEDLIREKAKKFERGGIVFKTLSFLRLEKYFYPQVVGLTRAPRKSKRSAESSRSSSRRKTPRNCLSTSK